MTILLFSIGLALVLIGFSFIYKSHWILKINQFARERVFNDKIVLLERRKRGTVLLLVSFIFFSLGYYRAQYTYNRLSDTLVSTDRLLYQSRRHLYTRHFDKSRELCQRVLMREPNNVQALYQLGVAQFLMNDLQGGHSSWTRANEINPNYPEAQELKEMVAKLGGSTGVVSTQ